MLDISKYFETFPLLETERCLLRELRTDDVAEAFEFMKQDEVTAYLPMYTAETHADVEAHLQRNIGRFYEQTGMVWGVVNRANGRLMGTCTLFNVSTAHHRAELGYMLGTAWWRQGYMFEVTTRVVNFAFAEMGFHSLEARIDPANVASEKLLLKLGFVQEAYFRENFYDAKTGTFGDTAMFSLLRSGWGKLE